MKPAIPATPRPSFAPRYWARPSATALLAAAVSGLMACGAVPFLDRDPSLPRDRASRFDRFVNEVHLSLRDTAGPLEWAQRDALMSHIGDDESSAWGRGHWSAQRRRALLRENLERHLVRLEDEFSPARFESRRATTARILGQDLRRALDLSDTDEVSTAAPELPAPVASAWSGLWIEAPTILSREHPARTAEQVQDWLGIVEWMAESEAVMPGLEPSRFEETYGPRAAYVAKALLLDVSLRQATTGSGLASDPLLGPLLEARDAIPGPEKAKMAGFDDGPLQRALHGKTDDWYVAVRNLQQALEGRNKARTVAYLTGSQRDRWLRRLGDSIGREASPTELDAVARAEIARLTVALGESLGLEDPSDLEATRKAFAQIRSGSRIVPGANLPVRSPLELGDLLRTDQDAFIVAPPEVLFASAQGATFERPHGRWNACVPGDLRPANDPVSRPFLYLRPAAEDPTAPRWLWEAESVRFGVRGEALADAYRRAATDQPLYLRAKDRETFRSAWGLYAAAEVFLAGELREEDRGFGWRVQELCAFAAVIVDIGMHDRGWSQRQALDAFLEMTPVPDAMVEERVLRSITNPGRDATPALALLTIRELRQEARALLGDGFRADVFHSTVLTGGPVPMSELPRRVQAWLAEAAVEAR